VQEASRLTGKEGHGRRGRERRAEGFPARAARTGQEVPPRLLTYYLGLLVRTGRPPALTTDRAIVRGARNAMAAVPGAQGLCVLLVPPRPGIAAVLAEDSHFAT
jgi:hypothetical protein